jgi:hypothetical protein
MLDGLAIAFGIGRLSDWSNLGLCGLCGLYILTPKLPDTTPPAVERTTAPAQ